jgi:hypothetical protein
VSFIARHWNQLLLLNSKEIEWEYGQQKQENEYMYTAWAIEGQKIWLCHHLDQTCYADHG